MTVDELKDYCNAAFEYSPAHKTLVNRIKRSGNSAKGSISGTLKRGYYIISINGTQQLAHRIVFLMNNNYLPAIVDHKDRDTLNNEPSNLRAASFSGNSRNISCGRSNNLSGYKGVSWQASKGKWRATIGCNGNIHLGLFDCKHEAARVYNTASRMYHGEFSNINLMSTAAI